MKTSGGLLLLLSLALAAAGCTALTPEQSRELEARRQQAANVLDTFATAIRQDTPELVEPLLAPALSGGMARELRKRAESVVWLQRYSGYTLDSQAALDRVSRKDWQRGAFRVEVRASNDQGERLWHEFGLVLVDSHWRIRDFKLNEPVQGEALDLPAAVKAEVMPQLAFILENMKEGRMADVFYELPDRDVCRRRSVKLSWWERIFSGGAGGWVSLYDDLERAKQFHFPDWPDPDEVYAWAYAAPSGIMALYEVPYVWREGGIDEPDMLSIRLVFMKTGDRWRLYTLRLIGKGIADT